MSLEDLIAALLDEAGDRYASDRLEGFAGGGVGAEDGGAGGDTARRQAPLEEVLTALLAEFGGVPTGSIDAFLQSGHREHKCQRRSRRGQHTSHTPTIRVTSFNPTIRVGTADSPRHAAGRLHYTFQPPWGTGEAGPTQPTSHSVHGARSSIATAPADVKPTPGAHGDELEESTVLATPASPRHAAGMQHYMFQHPWGTAEPETTTTTSHDDHGEGNTIAHAVGKAAPTMPNAEFHHLGLTDLFKQMGQLFEDMAEGRFAESGTYSSPPRGSSGSAVSSSITPTPSAKSTGKEQAALEGTAKGAELSNVGSAAAQPAEVYELVPGYDSVATQPRDMASPRIAAFLRWHDTAETQANDAAQFKQSTQLIKQRKAVFETPPQARDPSFLQCITKSREGTKGSRVVVELDNADDTLVMVGGGGVDSAAARSAEAAPPPAEALLAWENTQKQTVKVHGEDIVQPRRIRPDHVKHVLGLLKPAPGAGQGGRAGGSSTGSRRRSSGSSAPVRKRSKAKGVQPAQIPEDAEADGTVARMDSTASGDTLNRGTSSRRRASIRGSRRGKSMTRRSSNGSNAGGAGEGDTGPPVGQVLIHGGDDDASPGKKALAEGRAARVHLAAFLATDATSRAGFGKIGFSYVGNFPDVLALQRVSWRDRCAASLHRCFKHFARDASS